MLPYDALLTRDDVSKVKPDPEHLLAALELLGVEVGEALMMGDHLLDVASGKAVGTKTAGVLRPGRPDNYFRDAQPDVVVSSVGEILQYL